MRGGIFPNCPAHNVGHHRGSTTGAEKGNGVLAQLVEHLHGMQGVSGSNPLSSTISCLTVISGWSQKLQEFFAL